MFTPGTSMYAAFSGNVLTSDACPLFTGGAQSATQIRVETVIASPGTMRARIVHGAQDNLIPIDSGTAFGNTNCSCRSTHPWRPGLPTTAVNPKASP